jgi:hypothetical protein
MQVNVFISDVNQDKEPTLLVLPYGPLAAIPQHLQGIEWRHLAVTSPVDKLLGESAERIEEAIGKDGYALVSPTG